jgi:hypothetical protein
LKTGETQIAWSKIELFVVKRVIRDVHFAILAGDGSVGVDDYGRIVIDPSGSFFKEGRDNNDLVVPGELSQGFCSRAGNGFGESKVPVIFVLAKVP